MTTTLEFTRFDFAKPWRGRYARIPGKDPAFHVSVGGIITAQWTDRGEDQLLTARLVSSPAGKALAEALNETKDLYSGHPGGSFLINEYGQVICPIWKSRDRYWVGDIRGVPEFQDLAGAGTFTLVPPKGLKPGDRWSHPYIGMKFTLFEDNRIRFKHEVDHGVRWIEMTSHDQDLVDCLREVRPFGVVRFIVNLHGAAFTKVQDDDGTWIPVFVGHINRDRWYPREM